MSKETIKTTKIKLEKIPFFTAKTNKRGVSPWEEVELWCCPICGGVPEIVFDQTGNTGKIMCKDCGLTTAYQWMGAKGQRGMLDDLEENWNRNILLPELLDRDAKIERLMWATLSEAEIMEEAYAAIGTKRRYKKNPDLEADWVQ